MSELIEKVKEVLKINSASSFQSQDHQGNLDVALFLKSWVSDRLEVKIFESNRHPKDVTFVCWPKSQAFPEKGGLALHTHLDTVQAGKLDRWTEAGPFEAKEKNDWIYALGAADVKSDAICKLSALLEFSEQKDFKHTPFFIGSFAEEIGMEGARWIYDNKLIHPSYALVGEPSDGKICFANKGLYILEAQLDFIPTETAKTESQIHYEGVSGHSSSPHRAQNALEMALDDLEYQLEKQTPISNFEGSVASNVIPGHFSFLSKPDLIPTDTLKALVKMRKSHRLFQKEIASLLQNPIFEPAGASSAWTILKRHKNQIQIEIEGRFLPQQDPESLSLFLRERHPELRLKRSSPACEESREGEFVEKLLKASEDKNPWITKSGSNEAYFYQKLGAKVFVHGPGESYGNIHKPNEKIHRKSIEKAFRFYQNLIKITC